MTAMKRSKCLLCGGEYEVCKLCRDVIDKTPWRTLCDSPRHFQIYMIVLSIRDKTLTEKEAKAQLDNLQVTVKEIQAFVPSVRETLAPLYEVKEQPKNKKSDVKTEASN